MTIYLYVTNRNAETGDYDKTIKEVAEGCVLFTGSRSIRIWFDEWGTEEYACYWDDESNTVKTVGLSCSQSDEWYRKSYATIDASEEIWKKVETYYTAIYFQEYYEKALKESKQIIKDSIVKVAAGRQNKGVEGKVVAIIQRQYNMGYSSNIENKLGIATSDVMIDKEVNGKVYKNHRDVVWVWARNCEVTQPPPVDTKLLEEYAKENALRWIKSHRPVVLKVA